VCAFTGAASLLLHELWIPKEAPGVLPWYPTEVAAEVNAVLPDDDR
jgi:hypothetical protein